MHGIQKSDHLDFSNTKKESERQFQLCKKGFHMQGDLCDKNLLTWKNWMPITCSYLLVSANEITFLELCKILICLEFKMQIDFLDPIWKAWILSYTRKVYATIRTCPNIRICRFPQFAIIMLIFAGVELCISFEKSQHFDWTLHPSSGEPIKAVKEDENCMILGKDGSNIVILFGKSGALQNNKSQGG